MKKMRKVLALLIAMTMVIGTLSMTAFAAEDTKVSVQGLMEDDEVDFYQVLKWDEAKGWILAPGFTGLVGNAVFPSGATEAEIVDLIISDLTQDIADAISDQAAGATVKSHVSVASTGDSAEYTLKTTTVDGKTVVDPAELGLYMAIIAAGQPGYVYNPVFVSADFKDDNDTETITGLDSKKYGKASNVGTAKRVPNEVFKTTEDANSAIAQAIDSKVGETATFHVNTTIPVFLSSYQNPSFVLEDEIETSGIEFTSGSVEITLGSTKYTCDTTPYTETGIFTFTEDGNKGYKFEFDEDYLKANKTPVSVKIDYKGKITNQAAFNVNEDDNTVTVTYSNGPTTEKAALRDKTNHYTFSIGAKAFGESEEDHKVYELVKVAADKDGKPIYEKRLVSQYQNKVERHPLDGAVFGLYTDAACTTLYTNDLYPSGATFTTGADGIITFMGLDAGPDGKGATYYVKEISAPSGFVKDSRVAEVKIEATYRTETVADTVDNGIKVKGYETEVLKSYKVSVNNASVYDSDKDQYINPGAVVETNYEFNSTGDSLSTMTSTINDSELVNPPGAELPSTGGIGTTMFYTIGAILVIGAGVLMVSRRRMHAE